MIKISEPIVESKLIKGGEFLIKDSKIEDTFIPEELSEEQLMIKDTIEEFIKNEIKPVDKQLENQKDGLMVSLLEKAGALGLLGSHMPKQFGGIQLDTNTNTLICEKIVNSGGSFSTAFNAHTGIGMLSILYYGTKEQKEKYLPGLISGALQVSYCLTEPSSGSDALSAKTTAMKSEDGEYYVINGQKMWITNAGFASIFIVFAQFDGDKFTGVIVDKGAKGMTLGAEEDKLGIKGSSTRQVFFENVRVPRENILGEIGKGHLIAFNALNIGRFKLGVMTNGGAKSNCTEAIQYANARIQFAKPISSFGAIQYKLAEQAIRNFAVESGNYRVSNLLQMQKEQLIASGFSFGDAKLQAAKEYAIECSILKVAGSEALDYTVDETMQIHGGLGFSEEMSAARAYRDARINRIFEGTNEINRILMVDMLFKKAFKGKLDIISPAWKIQNELKVTPEIEKVEGRYGAEILAVKNFKKINLMVAGFAGKMQMEGNIIMKEEQEVLMNVADMMIDTFIVESTLLRVMKLEKFENKIEQDIYDSILRVLITDTSTRMFKNAQDALCALADEAVLETMLTGAKRFSKYPAYNVVKARRLIASKLIEANQYCF